MFKTKAELNFLEFRVPKDCLNFLYCPNFRVEINGRRQMNLVNKLSPFAAYQFRIAAYNEIGMGEYSEPSPSYNTR